MIHAAVYFAVSDILVNRFLNGFTVYHPLNLVLGIPVSPFYQTADNAVGTGIGPVGSRQLIPVCQQIAHIENDAPWIVYIGITEYITVIPLFDRIIFFRHPVIFAHLSHLV